ncbi:MAG: HAD family hydrolase [Coriobacteriia bacterium]
MSDESDTIPFEAVLFDFDGTLIDTCELIRVSFRYATRVVLGEAVPDEVLTRNVGAPLIEQMEEIAPGRGRELVEVYREFNHAKHDELTRPFDGVEEMLRHLQGAGVPLGVVTSKGRVAVQLGVDLIGLDRFTDTVITADDVEIHKPDPHPLLVAAERLGVDIRQTMYVGDSPHDVASANAAGAVSVAALWGMFTEEQLLAASPDELAMRPSDVVEIFERRRVKAGRA